MSKLTAEIPLSKIAKLQVYINTDKKTLGEIMVETGADYGINGGLYDMNAFQPVCHLKADGTVYAKDQYSYWGYGWNTGPDISMLSAYSSLKNYICCVAMIKGEAKETMYYSSAVGGKRGRSAIGLTGESLFLYCSKDGTENDIDPLELQARCMELGLQSAVMLDSGGSSQCDFAGQKIVSDRKVHNLILVYLKKEDKPLKKVCLDPGHGVETAGKCSPDKTYYEHEFNLDLVRLMKPMLERHGVEVTLTRNDEHDVTLANRVKIANAITDLDLFVSIHTNAAGNDGWYSAKGLTCYTSAAGDTAGRNIAANKLLARFKEAGITLRGTPLAHVAYYVLRKTYAPAVLIEHGFHTNKEETALLKTSAYRDKLAVAECKGILDYLGITWQEETDYASAVQDRFGLSDAEITYLAAYENANALLAALATKN